MINRFSLLVLPTIIFWLLTLPLSQERDAHGVETLPVIIQEANGSGDSESSPKEFIRLKIPLFSSHFDDMPVALVNEEPITLSELEQSLSAQPGTVAERTERQENGYLRVLNRLISSRLIIEEARNIGLDEIKETIVQIEAFKAKLLQRELIERHLQGLEADPDDVAEVYQQISREMKLDTITVKTGSEAQEFLDEVKEGGYEQAVQKYVAEGRAEEKRAEAYVKIKDLRMQVRQQAYAMEVGGVSSAYRTEDGFLVFHLSDARFVEDPAVEQEAIRIALDTLRKQKAVEYTNALSDKYVIFDEELYESLDFDNDFESLLADTRVLATVKKEEPIIITVGDLAKNLDINFFHGADKAQQLKMINNRKDIAISNMLFQYTSELEAQHLGLEQTEEFKKKMSAFEKSTLFSAFMNKIILPDVQLTAEEVRSYYDEHIDQYSSPAMLKMNSLVFKDRQDAENALEKIQKGADYKWVSANATGFVPEDTDGVLSFDQNLLSMTALPDDLQHDIATIAKGGSLLYAPSEGDYFYVLLVDNIFPPEPQPYEKVRDEVAKVVFNIKSEKLLDEYAAKLKEVYETQIFISDTDN